MNQELLERIQMYLMMWTQSDAASRVDQVEGFSLNHGFEQYQGKSISSYIEFMLNDFLLFLAERPELLKSVKTEVQLAEEKRLVEEAITAFTQMKSYFWGVLDPRYRKERKKLRDILYTLNY